jgi:hypothetical protein
MCSRQTPGCNPTAGSAAELWLGFGSAMPSIGEARPHCALFNIQSNWQPPERSENCRSGTESRK